MAGYTRQSVADIVANAVIKAAPVNAEYNAIRDAFTHATGHKHDGSSTEGAYVPLIADVDALNKVVVDTANNRISFFVQVGNGTVEQLRIQDGAFVPVSDSDIDLGAAGAEFKNLYIDGIGYIDTLAVHENATIAGTLGVTGLSTLASVDINGGNIDATVIGAATPAAATVTTLVATTADINAGTVDATIGGTTPAVGTFTSVIAATADINAGTVDATIGGTTPAAGTFTAIIAGTADINSGTIDGTIIGASTPAAATITSLVATTADINGGTIDGSTIAGGTLNNAQIGNTTASTVVGTTVTASNFVGPIAGAVTGNVTGNTAGVHTGAVTGNVTGNIASTGSSSFTDLTINGSLNMNAGTSGTITGLSNPVQGTDAATKTYVDAKVAAVLDSAPAALDTLNELAAALGDDANYASTTTAAIATKLAKAGGTMSGAIAMGNNKVTGLGAPTAGTDVTHKTYVDAGDALQVLKAGDTMSGVLAMGANKITGVADPTTNQDAATKVYVDTVLGSATAAATSASNASTSETNAGNSATAAAASYDAFDDRFLGSKSSNPSVDNDGASLLTGAMYWSTSASAMRVYSGSAWVAMAPSAADQSLINIVGGQLTATEDLGSIATATTTSVGNKISVVGNAIANVNTVAGIAANVTTAAGISGNITTTAGISSNVTTVAGISSNVTTVAGISTDVTTVAGKAAQVTLLGTSDAVADMNTLGTADVVADLNTLGTADVVSDMNTLGTADVVSDMNTLGTSGNVTNMNTLAGISSNITTVAGISANVTTAASRSAQLAILGTTAVAADLAILGTTDVVADLNTLGTADVVADLNTLGTADVVSDMNTLAAISSNVTSVAGSISNVNIVGASIADVNRYANQYTISSSAPSSPDAGDLWYDSSSGVNTLKYYTSSVWASISAGIASVAGDTSPQLAGTLDGQNNNLTNIGTVSGTNLQMDFGGL